MLIQSLHNYQVDKKLKKEIIARADLLLSGQMVLNRKWDMEKFNKQYDFSHLDFSFCPIDDKEYNYVLNRMEFLYDLYYAYVFTENDEYIDKLKELLFIKINQNKYDDRTLDIAIQLVCISKIYHSKIIEFSEQENQKLLDYVKGQVNFLKQFYITKYDLSNWGFIIKTAIVLTSEIFDIKENQDIKCQLYKMMDLQILNDGMHWEQSDLYHAHIMFCLKNLLDYGNMDKGFINDKFTKMKNALLVICDVNYDGIAINDGDYNNFRAVASLDVELIKDIKYEEQLEFGCGYIKEQNNINNYFLSDSLIYRYQCKELFLTVSNTPLGSGHGHLCPMHINVRVDNKEICMDSGRGTYEETSERYNLKSLKWHNTFWAIDDYHSVVSGSWTNEKYVTNKYLKIEKGKNENPIIITGGFASDKHTYQRRVIIIENKIIVFDTVNSDVELISNFIGKDIDEIKIFTTDVIEEEINISRHYQSYEKVKMLRLKNNKTNIAVIGESDIEMEEKEKYYILRFNDHVIVLGKGEIIANNKYFQVDDVVLYGQINIIKNKKVILRSIL